MSARTHIRQTLGVDESTPLIFAVGRFDRIKRLDILIKALSNLKSSHDFTLLIAGNSDAQFAAELHRISKGFGMDGRIIWAGLVPYEDLPQYYAASDLFVHLSIDENFGMVVAEAMATGIPIIVSPGVGIWHEILSESVGQCVSLDVDAVSNTLADFLNHRDKWARYGNNAVDVARRQFSPEKIGDLMGHSFDDVINDTQSAKCNWYIPKSGIVNHDPND